MKYNIKIGNSTFEVEIDDVNKRPIIARVDGQEFEVSPDNGLAQTDTSASRDSAELNLAFPVAHTHAGQSDKTIVAPLPGTVIDVFVKPGDTVESGQVIMIIEAMKMKNSIRSVRDGIVASVPVKQGETVAHKQILVEFNE